MSFARHLDASEGGLALSVRRKKKMKKNRVQTKLTYRENRSLALFRNFEINRYT